MKRQHLLTNLCAMAVSLALASAAHASPYAAEVTSSSGPFGSSPHDDPQAVLGAPATDFKHQPLGGGAAELRRVKLLEAAFNVGPDDEKLLTTLGSSASIVTKFDHKVRDNASNDFNHGIDFLVFGNSQFTGSSGFVDDDTNMNTHTITDPATGIFEQVRVSVSQDGGTWHTFDSGPFADAMFPTNAYKWDADNAQWTDELLDFTKPVDPSLTMSSFAGKTGAEAIALYDGSAGGTGFDLSDLNEPGLDWIQYVRVDVPDGVAGGEIDAIADVPVPEPSSAALMLACGALLLCRRRRDHEAK